MASIVIPLFRINSFFLTFSFNFQLSFELELNTVWLHFIAKHCIYSPYLFLIFFSSVHSIWLSVSIDFFLCLSLSCHGCSALALYFLSLSNIVSLSLFLYVLSLFCCQGFEAYFLLLCHPLSFIFFLSSQSLIQFLSFLSLCSPFALIAASSWFQGLGA